MTNVRECKIAWTLVIVLGVCLCEYMSAQQIFFQSHVITVSTILEGTARWCLF